MHPNRSANFIRSSGDCVQVQARLFDLLDGALPGDERSGLERHLAQCATCRAELEACRHAERALHAAKDSLPAAGDLRAGFYARLAQEQRSAASRTWAVLPLWGSALTVGAIAFWIVTRPAAPLAPIAGEVPGPQQSKSTAQIAQGESAAPFENELPGGLYDYHGAPKRVPSVTPVRNAPEKPMRMRRFVKRVAPPQQVVRLTHEEHLTPVTPLASAIRFVHHPEDTNVFMYQKKGKRAKDYAMALSYKAKDIPVERGAKKAALAESLAETGETGAASDTVDLVVTDQVRGFETRTQIAGYAEEANGDQVVTIEAEESPNQ